METSTIWWGVIAALVGAIGTLLTVFYTMQSKQIEGKQSKDMCERNHRILEKDQHTHGEHGSAGEVVKR
jgi:hypothetical protein